LKGYVKALILIIVGLAILIPFASSYLDGSEKVTETLHVQESQPLWKGLMPDYTLPTYCKSILIDISGGPLRLNHSFGSSITP